MEDWLKILIPIIILAPIGFLFTKYWDNFVIYLKRQKLKIFPANFNIGISFDHKEGEKSGDYFNEIKKRLLILIDDNNLSKQIKVHDFSKEQKFNNKEEAEHFRNKKNIDLIIWGNFSNKNLRIDGEEICSIDIKFTFGHPKDKDNKIGELLLMDISSKMAQKNYWNILENSSYNDTIKISNNIFDIGTYIIAIVLQLYGKIYQSATLFERLYEKNSKDEDNNIFQKQLIPHIIACYIPIIINLGIINKNFKDAKKYCKKILEFVPYDFFSLSSLAVFQYKSGEEEESEITVNKLLTNYPNSPLAHANVAFFRLIQKKYKSAFKYYNKLISCEQKAINFNPLDLVEFLYLEYEKRKDPAFLYASGIISYYLVKDEKLAKKDLERFINSANEVKYKDMCRKAKKLIK